MTVTVSQDQFELTDALDEVLQPTIVQSVRFVGEVGSVAGDIAAIVDPVTGGPLWNTIVSGPNMTEAELLTSGNGNGRVWPNGFRIGTLTGNRGAVYVRYI